MTTIHRSDKRKNPEPIEYRLYASIDELKEALGRSNQFYILDANGKIADCRTNGGMKAWKRDSQRIEQSFKFGMYECFRLTGEEMLGQLVVKL